MMQYVMVNQYHMIYILIFYLANIAPFPDGEIIWTQGLRLWTYI